VNLFADRDALWSLPLMLVLCIGTSVAWAVLRAANPPPVRVCIDDPASCEGQVMVQPLLTVKSVSPTGYVAGRTYYEISVLAETTGLRVGQEVTVSGRWTNGAVAQSSRVLHEERRGKFGLGLVGLMACGALVLGGFAVRRTTDGWRVVERG
jgi:hypothetical protein